jgi:hypothetical protein
MLTKRERRALVRRETRAVVSQPRTIVVAPRNAPRRRRRARTRMPSGVPGLDTQAACWARLLSDPCNAPLCHPCYTGSNGGILVRGQTTFTLSPDTTGDTAHIFIWSPGGAKLSYASAVDASTGTALTSHDAGIPAFGVLATQVSEFRCAAACIKLTWGGTELNRQGYVQFGNFNYGALATEGVSWSASQVGQLLENATRIPEETMELKFRPTAYDENSNQINQGVDLEIDPMSSKRGAIGFSVSSLPTTGYSLIIELTAVYEYTPAFGTGITAATTSRSTSNNTLDHVINALDRTGNWMYKVGNVLGHVYQAGRTAYNAFSAVTNPMGTIAGGMARLALTM